MDRSSTTGPNISALAAQAETVALQADQEQELQAALQLLANRARYVTGAAISIIAVGEGDGLVCKASSGTMAPSAGTQLQIDGGLTSELMAACVTTRLPVRCGDAQNDERISSDECREQGIGSLLLAPLFRENEVSGIFQLTAEGKSAFEERDVATLQRLADAVRTVLEQKLIFDVDSPQTPVQSASPSPHPKLASLALRTGRIPLPQRREPSAEEKAMLSGGQSLRRCRGCGFPVSPGRSLCLDCEAAEIAHGGHAAVMYGQSLSSPPSKKRNWLDEHFYSIGMILVTVLTLVVLFLWAR